MSTTFRFPTTPERIPIHPRSSVFQTVKEDLEMPDIEEVMTRPRWDFEEANLRLFKEKKAREAAAARKAARAKGRPAPKRKPDAGSNR